MGIINTNESLYRDIDYNFKIIESTLQEGKKIDLYFIEIFANDIQELRAKGFDQGRVSNLTKRLEGIANRICDATTSLRPVEHNPLVGDMKQDLTQLARQKDPGFVKEGLNQLNPHFEMKRIYGDGHCLFRAFATGTLDYLKDLPQEKKNEFLTQLDTTVANFNDPDLSSHYNSKIRGMLSRGQNLNEQESNEMVAFLRLLACTYNRTNKNETFSAFLTAERTNKDEYLKNMTDMTKGVYGAEPELIALQKTLNINFRVIDTLVVGKKEAEPASYLNHAPPNTIFLLYTPLHYDVAYPKKETFS